MPKGEQKVSATQEDYLEAILCLTRENGEARARDIARELTVHKSTVTAALKALGERGLVNYAPYEIATLTDSGRRIAQRVFRGHRVVRRFLRDVLAIDEGTAEANACRMEHVMDKDVMDRLLVFAECIKECPDLSKRFAAALRKNGAR